ASRGSTSGGAKAWQRLHSACTRRSRSSAGGACRARSRAKPPAARASTAAPIQGVGRGMGAPEGSGPSRTLGPMRGRRVTRRAFLDGARLGLGAAALSPLAGLLPRGAAAAAGEAPFPPALQGMRGSHDGSWEAAHALVAGKRFPSDTDVRRDDVDLVVVGAGISGLAAAWLWRRRRPESRILVLDNHDDFGGHAKRNEFRVDGRLLIGYGG